MIYFYRRGVDTRSCETRLDPYGARFELIVNDVDGPRVEHFEDAMAMASREYELRHAWLLSGWRTIGSDDEYDEY